jgi:O-antigen/teichoic acid export membrane protein
VLLGLDRIRAWNYIQIASPVLTVAGTLLLVVALGGGVHAALAAWTGAHMLTALFALFLTRDVWRPFRIGPVFDGPARDLARLALAMGALQVISLIGYRAELFVLEAVKGVGAVGVYSIANQAVESLWLIAAAVATSLTAPIVRVDEHEAIALVKRSAARSLVYTAVAAGALAAVAPFVIPLALGDDFKGAVKPLLLLLPGAVAYAPVQVLVAYLSVRHGRAGLSLAAGIVALVVTVAAAVPLVSAYGAAGAAGASALGYVCGSAAARALFARVSARASRVQPRDRDRARSGSG